MNLSSRRTLGVYLSSSGKICHLISLQAFMQTVTIYAIGYSSIRSILRVTKSCNAQLAPACQPFSSQLDNMTKRKR